MTSDFKCPVFLQMPHEYEYRLLIGTDQVSVILTGSRRQTTSISINF